mmetsp:Transcript_6745/g.12006  ORF Transcript_6745/g.12006 Transcript_6745/m.12006 type:complete len:88 (+) Transcript_6745:631-894(+)
MFPWDDLAGRQTETQSPCMCRCLAGMNKKPSHDGSLVLTARAPSRQWRCWRERRRVRSGKVVRRGEVEKLSIGERASNVSTDGTQER